MSAKCSHHDLLKTSVGMPLSIIAKYGASWLPLSWLFSTDTRTLHQALFWCSSYGLTFLCWLSWLCIPTLYQHCFETPLLQKWPKASRHTQIQQTYDMNSYEFDFLWIILTTLCLQWEWHSVTGTSFRLSSAKCLAWTHDAAMLSSSPQESKYYPKWIHVHNMSVGVDWFESYWSFEHQRHFSQT